jgi:dipeptide/tripeptide permease
MSVAATLTTVRRGFLPTFWIANTLELFERFSYYAATAVLAVYFAETVKLGAAESTALLGLFTGLLYFLPILAGTIVDRYGFKFSLLLCFAIFSLGYCLIGLPGLAIGKPVVEAVGATSYMYFALIVTAMGGSLIKPSIVGTVARTTTPTTKDLGYSIYYTLVNIGGAVGPALAVPVRENVGIAYVLVMSSLTSLTLCVATLLFFKEPPRPVDAPAPTSMLKVLRDMFIVLANLKFMSFLLIFSCFWVMFWQIFYSLPFYVKDSLGYSRFEFILSVDAWTIILLVTPLAAVAKRMSAMMAMVTGFALASACWFIMGTFPTVTMTIAAIVVFAMGEALQAPRYYGYVADLAPKEQVGTYMGYAFLPVAIGAIVAGKIAGPLVERYVQSGHPHPSSMWYVIGTIGVVATLAMLAYDRLVVRRQRA